MAVVVYSKPACVQCTATIKEMERKGISYEKVDISKDEDALNKIISLGFRQAPVVITDEDQWSGFRPDKIAALG